MKKVLPTLSIFGFTDDPQIITEKLFLYFLTSEYSQSVTFYGKISSLKYLLSNYATNPLELRESIEETLLLLYKKYFKNVEINVEIEFEKNIKKFILIINIITKSEDGNVSSINEKLSIENNTINNLLEIINK